ncbi:MAG: response regulator transcription factor [Chloroflexota bacterium]
MNEAIAHTTMQKDQKITVVVADDHPIVRAGIISELKTQSDIHIIGEALDGDQTLQVVQETMPDVLVLDLSMPGLPTQALLEQVLTLPKNPHVLILTAYGDVEQVMSLLHMGVKGYVMKDEDPQAITTAIRAVHLGGIWLSASVATGMLSQQTTPNNATNNGNTDDLDLSGRELDVLKLLVEGKDNSEIGEALYISERTVRFHLRNIYDKLGVHRRGEAIAAAIRRGL